MRLPDTSQRISIIGRTGSGKTVAAAWHLSEAPFDRLPYVIYDFKGDELLGRIEALDGAETLGIGQTPKRPGLYFVHPLPHEADLVEEQMWRIWAQGYTGVYIDEGYMVGNSSPAFRALLTQGRSKRIPMIILSQRPVWLDVFVFSESDFYQVFFLNTASDRKKIMEYFPANINRALPKHHSYYHDVGRGETVVLKPVPSPDAIVDRFRARLEAMKPKRRVLVI